MPNHPLPLQHLHNPTGQQIAIHNTQRPKPLLQLPRIKIHNPLIGTAQIIPPLQMRLVQLVEPRLDLVRELRIASIRSAHEIDICKVQSAGVEFTAGCVFVEGEEGFVEDGGVFGVRGVGGFEAVLFLRGGERLERFLVGFVGFLFRGQEFRDAGERVLD